MQSATGARPGRRMVSLGKIAAPKPINLPSQKKENNGVDPSVNIVGKNTSGVWRDPNSGQAQKENQGAAWNAQATSPPPQPQIVPARVQSAGPAWGGAGLPEKKQSTAAVLNKEEFPTLDAAKEYEQRRRDQSSRLSSRSDLESRPSAWDADERSFADERLSRAGYGPPPFDPHSGYERYPPGDKYQYGPPEGWENGRDFSRHDRYMPPQRGYERYHDEHGPPSRYASAPGHADYPLPPPPPPRPFPRDGPPDYFEGDQMGMDRNAPPRRPTPDYAQGPRDMAPPRDLYSRPVHPRDRYPPSREGSYPTGYRDGDNNGYGPPNDRQYRAPGVYSQPPPPPPPRRYSSRGSAYDEEGRGSASGRREYDDDDYLARRISSRFTPDWGPSTNESRGSGGGGGGYDYAEYEDLAVRGPARPKAEAPPAPPRGNNEDLHTSPRRQAPPNKEIADSKISPQTATEARSEEQAVTTDKPGLVQPEPKSPATDTSPKVILRREHTDVPSPSSSPPQSATVTPRDSIPAEQPQASAAPAAPKILEQQVTAPPPPPPVEQPQQPQEALPQRQPRAPRNQNASKRQQGKREQTRGRGQGEPKPPAGDVPEQPRDAGHHHDRRRRGAAPQHRNEHTEQKSPRSAAAAAAAAALQSPRIPPPPPPAVHPPAPVETSQSPQELRIDPVMLMQEQHVEQVVQSVAETVVSHTDAAPPPPPMLHPGPPLGAFFEGPGAPGYLNTPNLMPPEEMRMQQFTVFGSQPGHSIGPEHPNQMPQFQPDFQQSMASMHFGQQSSQPQAHFLPQFNLFGPGPGSQFGGGGVFFPPGILSSQHGLPQEPLPVKGQPQPQVTQPMPMMTFGQFANDLWSPPAVGAVQMPGSYLAGAGSSESPDAVNEISYQEQRAFMAALAAQKHAEKEAKRKHEAELRDKTKADPIAHKVSQPVAPIGADKERTPPQQKPVEVDGWAADRGEGSKRPGSRTGGRGPRGRERNRDRGGAPVVDVDHHVPQEHTTRNEQAPLPHHQRRGPSHDSAAKQGTRGGLAAAIAAGPGHEGTKPGADATAEGQNARPGGVRNRDRDRRPRERGRKASHLSSPRANGDPPSESGPRQKPGDCPPGLGELANGGDAIHNPRPRRGGRERDERTAHESNSANHQAQGDGIGRGGRGGRGRGGREHRPARSHDDRSGAHGGEGTGHTGHDHEGATGAAKPKDSPRRGGRGSGRGRGGRADGNAKAVWTAKGDSGKPKSADVTPAVA